jgi:hypothetical protein
MSSRRERTLQKPIDDRFSPVTSRPVIAVTENHQQAAPVMTTPSLSEGVRSNQ